MTPAPGRTLTPAEARTYLVELEELATPEGIAKRNAERKARRQEFAARLRSLPPEKQKLVEEHRARERAEWERRQAELSPEEAELRRRRRRYLRSPEGQAAWLEKARRVLRRIASRASSPRPAAPLPPPRSKARQGRRRSVRTAAARPVAKACGDPDPDGEPPPPATLAARKAMARELGRLLADLYLEGCLDTIKIGGSTP